jgi:hypothetical protein
VIDESKEEPLGITCAFCEEEVRYYAGEFQNRIHCGCTMVMFPMAYPDPDEEETLVGDLFAMYTAPRIWRTTIEQAQQLSCERRKN